MSAAFNRVVQQNQLALREGVKIVRNILATTPAPTGFTTNELFKLALKEAPPAEYQPPVQPTPPPVPTMHKHKKRPKLEVPEAPHPEHPVRSMSFLKRHILPFLEGQRELKKGLAERVPAHASVAAATKKGKLAQDAAGGAGSAKAKIWVWQPVDPSTLPPPPAPKEPKVVYGEEVGVGEDLGHLSKRRERARREKIRADVHAMKVAAGIAKYRERSAAGMVLRAKQAAQAERKQQREEERRAQLEGSGPHVQSTPRNPDTKDSLKAVATLFAKRRAADARPGRIIH
ncbi:hypothetical protein FPV67DRAFT_1163167 [Lyophyllum atratum]|nr:hypothetical protein FPV67DRAFT_1163167 [Lyophyllum atratum]